METWWRKARGRARRRLARLRRSVLGAVERGPVGRGLDRRRQLRLRESEEEHRLAASERWRRKDHDGSFREMRAALLVRGGTAALWRTYGTRLIEAGRPDAAWESIQAAIELDAGDVAAVEFYVELVHRRQGTHRGVRSVIEAMAAVAPARPEMHRDALDFLLPFGVTTGLAHIAVGPDAVAAAVARMALPDQDLGVRTFDPVDQAEAEARFGLGRGRISASVKVLQGLPPDRFPDAAVRRAIRRITRKPNPSSAKPLIALYRKHHPGDAWSKERAREVEAFIRSTDEAQHDRQLSRTGFPFSEPSPARPEVSRTALYLLHNSLPYTTAGYATRSHGLLKALNTFGWQMRGVTRPGFPYDLSTSSITDPIETDSTIDGVRYLRLSGEHEVPRKNPIAAYVQEYVRRLTPHAENSRPFVIHAASNHWNGLAAVEAGRQLGLPSIYEVRGLWEVTRASRDPAWVGSRQHEYMKRMEADAASGASHVFAITRALRSELVSRGVPEERISLLPNGVDTGRFVPRSKDVELAQQLGVVGKTVIGYVGSILDYEGIELLVEAAAMLKHVRTDFQVVIVGDGAALPSVRKAVETASAGDVVTLTGRVPHDEVERYYSVIDIAPLPRLPLPVCEMVSPLKPFEAMAMGKTVLASDVDALAEIVQHGETGLLHRKGDAASLAAELTVLLDSPELLSRLGAQAREWVVRERDWNAIATTADSVYADLYERHGRGQ